MKDGIHPEYTDTAISCACGNILEIKATVADMRVDVCSECHPFFTGKAKLLDTAGRIDKFNKKYGKAST